MRVAIANRGEVAFRIIRACQELGFESILLHSTADRGTKAFRAADKTVELTGDTSLETYLNIPKVVEAAVSAGAQMLHPGFGFLSENAAFASALSEAGIIFVGPPADVIAAAGNKVKAKELAVKAGVPTTPAYIGGETDPKKLLIEARKVGFPCIVKAASGGGGKGMKVVTQDSEFLEQLASAQREAKAAFGSDQVFIEKYIQNPRHIEIQIMCDEFGNRLHFFERECSIQRRHQKIFEETPSPALTPELRGRIAEAALRLAEAAGYINAGTVEFLLDDKNNFYFMELNTRLQVEHPVTELVCGVDLVQMQFAVAQGHKLSLKQSDITQRGHSLEVRVYAENPAQEFLPSTGEFARLDLPQGPHRRFDFGFEPGDSITPLYDPMIGKIITWAPTRAENIQRMLATLSETVIFGVHTNIEFLKDVLRDKDFQNGKFSTGFLEAKYKSGFVLPELSTEQKRLGLELSKKVAVSASASNAMGAKNTTPRSNPWIKTDAGGLS